MKKTLLLLIVIVLAACHAPQKIAIFQNNTFAVYPNRVVQGKNVAQVVSREEIRSNYQSTANTSFPRLISFKFSINEKDNEAPAGRDHWVVIGDEHESPLIVFGAPVTAPPPAPTGYLPVNYDYTFRAIS